MYRAEFWTLWEKARVGCFERTALKHVYYLGWNRSPAHAGCMRQVLRPGALGRPKGIGWRGRWEEGLGWGIHVNPWLIHVNVWQIHVNVWQKPLQYCKVISLQLIKINEKKKKKEGCVATDQHLKRVEGQRCTYASQVLDRDPSEGRKAQIHWRDKVIPSEGVWREPLRVRDCPGKSIFKEPT